MATLFSVHLIFDLLAASASALVTVALLLSIGRKLTEGPLTQTGPYYPLTLILGAVLGAHLLGTGNLILSGEVKLGRSILGAVLGAIVLIETYKWRTGLHGSTGALFAPGFALSVAIGRIGCYLTGLPDDTYGIATQHPWGVDFGDGIPRHPVQLYESGAMTFCFTAALLMLWRSPEWFRHYGFYLVIGVYGAQRFAWEFLKPYATLLGPLNLFHFGSAALVVYAIWMSRYYVRS